MVAFGEDKPEEKEFTTAVTELKMKHVGANAVLYGSLSYVLAVATGGPIIRFFALPVEQSTVDPIAISPRYDVRVSAERELVFRSAINLFRWAISVRSKLPQLPFSMLVPISRTSPYGIGFPPTTIR